MPSGSWCSSRPALGAGPADWRPTRGGTEGANIFQVRGGKVTNLSIYWDRKSALADLGLEE
jgi:hypothetical protein